MKTTYSLVIVASTMLHAAMGVQCSTRNAKLFAGNLTTTAGQEGYSIVLEASQGGGGGSCDFSGSDTGSFNGWTVTYGVHAANELRIECDESSCPPLTIDWEADCDTPHDQISFSTSSNSGLIFEEWHLYEVYKNKDKTSPRKALVSKFSLGHYGTPTYLLEHGDRDVDGYDVKISPNPYSSLTYGIYTVYLKVTNVGCSFLDWDE